MSVLYKQTQLGATSVDMPAHSWAADMGPGLASVGADSEAITPYSAQRYRCSKRAARQNHRERKPAPGKHALGVEAMN